MRAIDKYEDDITETLDRCDDEGMTLVQSIQAQRAHQRATFRDVHTAERLEHLIRVWCAVGGFDVPK